MNTMKKVVVGLLAFAGVWCAQADVGVKVNEVDVSVGSGGGWTFADGVLSLTNEQDYVLAGTNTAGAVRVEVTKSAAIELNNLKLLGTETTNVITFASGATNATLMLVGDNTIYAANSNATVCVHSNATVTISGSGALVGGKAESKVSCGVSVFGTLIMDGGTICGFSGGIVAGGISVGATGVLTMNSGAVTNNSANGYGGGVHNRGLFTMNGGVISGNVAEEHDGGGIWNGGTTTINGGLVANNTAKRFGGAVLSDLDALVTMNGGEVTGNKVVSYEESFGGAAFGVYGALVVNGGWIHENETGSQFHDCIVSRGTTSIYGGVFKEELYFRKGYGASEGPKLYGCECASNPYYNPVSGYEIQSVGTAKSGWYAFAKSGTVACTAAGLTAGTYTFCPTNAEYAAYGVAVADGRTVYVEDASPKTYTIAGDPTGVTINGLDAAVGSGDGWTFAGGVLSLTNASAYTLSGANTAGAVRVEVTKSANVTLDNVKLVAANPSFYEMIKFTSGATNATLMLIGDNTVYAQKNSGCAVKIASGAKVTMQGDGALVGSGSTQGPRCITVEGSFIMKGATICDYNSENEGGAVCVNSSGQFEMTGGTVTNCAARVQGGGFLGNYGTSVIRGGSMSGCFSDGGVAYVAAFSGTCNVYGGYFGLCPKDNTYFGKDSPATLRVYGIVFDKNLTQQGYRPSDYKAPGTECVEVGGNMVIGTNIATNENAQLTGGTYTFNPTNAEYAAVGVALADNREPVAQGGSPATWTIEPAVMTGVTIDGRDAAWNTGAGWTFADGVLKLTNEQDYVLAGTNTAGAVRVEVTESANVTVSNLYLTAGESVQYLISFDSNATKATLTILGANTIYSAGNDNHAAVCIPNGAKVTLSGEGEIVGGKAASAMCRAFYLDGTLTMNGGTIRDYSSGGGGAIRVKEGSFIMNSGAIRNCEASSSGGCIFMVSSANTVQIYGGTIAGCNAGQWGGVLHADGGNVMIYGGTFETNTVTQSDGALFNDNSGIVKVYGGVFTDKDVSSKIFRQNTYYSSGSITIYGCVCDFNPASKIKDVTIEKGVTQVGDSWIVGQDVAQTNTKLTGGTYTFNPTNAEYAAVGVALQANVEVVTQGGTPAMWTIEEKTKVGVAVDGQDLNWGSGVGWTFADGVLSLTNAMDYTLSGTNTAGAVRVEVAAANANVTLNNAKLTGLGTTNVITFASGVTNATLTLVGDNQIYAATNLAAVSVLSNATVTLSGGGALVGGSASSKFGVGINVFGTLTMNGGTIRNYYSPSLGGGLFIDTTGVVTMNGGTILDNKATNNGGGIGNSGSFTMNAGTIAGNTAQNHDGGAICCYGTAVINGGVISNNTAYLFGGAILSVGTVTMSGGEVTDNRVTFTDSFFGGTAFGAYGTLVVNGGWIHDNNTETENEDCIVSRGTVFVYGGVFQESRYFRIGTKGTESGTGVLNLYGGEFSSNPGYIPVNGYAVQSVNKAKSGWSVIAKKDTVTCMADGLTAGTYTFNPTNAEYAAAGVAVAPYRLVEKHDETEYVINVDPAGVTVNGTDISVLAGDGWTVVDGVLTLTNAQSYVLAGTNTAGAVRVEVTKSANVTVSNLYLTAGSSVNMITFAAGATDATLTLAGVNTVHSQGSKSAIYIASGAKVTVGGTGELVGGKADSVCCRACEVRGELVLMNGTIRDYLMNVQENAYYGCGVYLNGGRLTMNGGMISGCQNSWYGGAVTLHSNGGNNAKADLNGGTISNCTAMNGGVVCSLNGASVVNVRDGMVITDNGSYRMIFDQTKTATLNIWGGVICGNEPTAVFEWRGLFNISGGVVKNNSGTQFADDTGAVTARISGGEFSVAPADGLIVSGFAKTKVGDLYVVGQNVAQANTQLTGGTYTFNPTNAEYAAAGVAVEDGRVILAADTNPQTYAIGGAPTGVTINGMDAAAGSGTGWTFANGLLSLTNELSYVLSGTNTAICVDVTASANVTLKNLQLICTETTNVVTFASIATNATLTLSGTNTVYGWSDSYAAIDVMKEAKLTLDGDGELVGGRFATESVKSRCFNLEGTLVMNGGTIRDYLAGGGAALCLYGGSFTMNDGVLRNCKTTDHGGCILLENYGSNNATINGGMIAGCTTEGWGGVLHVGRGSVTISGGTFEENTVVAGGSLFNNNDGYVKILGGVIRAKDVSSPVFRYQYDPPVVCKFDIDGCVCDFNPSNSISNVDIRRAVTQVGDNYVVGANVTYTDAKLTGGTYTFNPTNAEYVAAGVAVAPYRLVEKHDETEYVIGIDLAGVTVGGTDISALAGDGWTVADGVLTLTNAQSYALAGTNTAGAVRVSVTKSATLELNSLKLTGLTNDVITFSSGATNATLTLVGDNMVYPQNDKAAVYVPAGAKVTLSGTGALVGGRAHGSDGRGVYVKGTFVMNGGVIAGYKGQYGGGIYFNGTGELNTGMITDCAASYGGAFALTSSGRVDVRSGMVISNNYASAHSAVFLQGGTINVWGGTYVGNSAAYDFGVLTDWAGTLNVYGGIITGNSSKPTQACAVYGLVSDKSPEGVVDGSAAKQVGDLYVIGASVTANDDHQLTGGTYTFNPTNAEYATAGVAVATGASVKENTTTPVTWTIGMALTYPDYLGPWSAATTNKFDVWATTYGSRDPDGVYTNAFLLNVATNHEAAAVAAFKFTSIVVTNDVADITIAQPLSPATNYNGAVWLQCATNELSAATWLDIANGCYTEKDKSFFQLKIDFEHTAGPSSFPTESEGTKTTRLYQH